ncbi:MAG: hypothetical protein KKE65_08285 [Actinobacteria bacterium]|nr:hypothetical protein [Actinomycetota bacterium]MBU2111642.1 hypothetical protein [Actinomycetota bacterium]
MAFFTRTRRYRRSDVSPWPFVGLVGLAACFFLYAASGPFTPWWAQTLLLLLWLVATVRAVGWWSERPTWVAWAPVACLVVWFVVIWAGAAWWGW